MKLTGHKTVALFMHYVRTEDKPVRDAAELMASRRLAVTGASRSAEVTASSTATVPPFLPRLSCRCHDNRVCRPCLDGTVVMP